MSKVLLFDFDGTIADSFDNFLEILDHILQKYHIPQIPHSELESLWSESASNLIKRLKIPFYKFPFIGYDMKRMQHRSIDKIKPFEDIPEVLHTLKNRGYKLGIMTSNGKHNISRFIKQHNLEIFDYMYTDISIFGKTHAMQKFLRQTSFPKDDVLYIGDEIRDIEACHKAGIQIIAVTWGYTTKNGLEKNDPHFIVNTPKELLELLTKT